MHDKEAIEMMRRCVAEMRDLRAQRDGMAPMAEAYEVIRDIVRLVPKPSRGYGEDVVWTLERRIKELEAAAKKDDA